MSSPVDQEIEAKFTIANLAIADHLRTAAKVSAAFHLGSLTTVEHVDTYVDTAAYAFLRAGFAVRIRHTGAGYRITVKSLLPTADRQLHRRLELEETLAEEADPLDQATWPSAIRDFLNEHLDAEGSFLPLFTIHQCRDKRPVTAAGKRGEVAPAPFAELSIDDIKIYSSSATSTRLLHPSDLAQAPPLTAFQELEVELLAGGDEAALNAFTQKLARRRGLRIDHANKFKRGLETVFGHLCINGVAITKIEPTLHLADACRLIWRQQLAQMLLLEAGVRQSTDIEYVHDLRVAVRRARTALRLFGGYFHKKKLHFLRDALKITGRRLGAVRDRDVALEKLAKFIGKGAAEQSAQAVIADAWQSERADAFEQLIEWFDSADYAEFLVRFSQLCATPGKGARAFTHEPGTAPTPFQVRHTLPGILMERFNQVRAFETLFESEAALTVETLHQLRIQCKFLRYALEFGRGLLGADGLHLIATLKTLQEYLGDLNDAAVSQRLLAATPTVEPGAAVAEYEMVQADTIAELRGRVRESLQNFLALENRRRLARAVTQI